MEKINIETEVSIKSFKVAHHLSEETLAFTGKLYIGKVYVADLCSRGHGGGVDYYEVETDGKNALKELSVLVKQFSSSREIGGRIITLDVSLNWFLAELAGSLDNLAYQKSQMRGRTFVRLEGQEYGGDSWSAFKIPYRNGAAIDHLEQQNKVVTECLNEQLAKKTFTISDILSEMGVKTTEPFI
tara:strand:+ start:149 stop:703 length:555 start_codon:yes stop_codon:yes gene_type:complete